MYKVTAERLQVLTLIEAGTEAEPLVLQQARRAQQVPAELIYFQVGPVAHLIPETQVKTEYSEAAEPAGLQVLRVRAAEAAEPAAQWIQLFSHH